MIDCFSKLSAIHVLFQKKVSLSIWYKTINTRGYCYYSLAKRQDRQFIVNVSSVGKGAARRAQRTFDSRPRLPAKPWGAIVTHNWWAARRGSRSSWIDIAQKKSPGLRIARVPPRPWWLYNVVSRRPRAIIIRFGPHFSASTWTATLAAAALITRIPRDREGDPAREVSSAHCRYIARDYVANPRYVDPAGEEIRRQS